MQEALQLRYLKNYEITHNIFTQKSLLKTISSKLLELEYYIFQFNAELYVIFDPTMFVLQECCRNEKLKKNCTVLNKFIRVSQKTVLKKSKPKPF